MLKKLWTNIFYIINQRHILVFPRTKETKIKTEILEPNAVHEQVYRKPVPSSQQTKQELNPHSRPFQGLYYYTIIHICK